jgi:hypothetical protein
MSTHGAEGVAAFFERTADGAARPFEWGDAIEPLAP